MVAQVITVHNYLWETTSQLLPENDNLDNLPYSTRLSRTRIAPSLVDAFDHYNVTVAEAELSVKRYRGLQNVPFRELGCRQLHLTYHSSSVIVTYYVFYRLHWL